LQNYGATELDNVQRQSRHISPCLIGPRSCNQGNDKAIPVGVSGNLGGLPDEQSPDWNFGANDESSSARLYSGGRGRVTTTIEEPNDTSSSQFEPFHTGGLMRRASERLYSVNERFAGPGEEGSSSRNSPREEEASPTILGFGGGNVGAGGFSTMERLRIGGALSFRSGSAPPEMDFFASGDFRSPINQAAVSTTSTKPDAGHAFGSTSLTNSPNTIPPISGSTFYPRSTAPPPPSHSTPPREEYGSDISDANDVSRATEKELVSYLRDTLQGGSQYGSGPVPTAHPSRGLCILASGLPPSSDEANTLNPAEVRSVCESFGTLDTFRSDFWNSRRVVFLSYFDLRCAQRAASGLLRALLRLVESACPRHVLSTAQFKVKYCLPLQASSPTDESTMLISNLPPHVDEHGLASFMESYGGVRSVHFVVTGANGSLDDDDNAAYMVEFYDTQVCCHSAEQSTSCLEWYQISYCSSHFNRASQPFFCNTKRRTLSKHF
jgi:hypothetical protein